MLRDRLQQMNGSTRLLLGIVVVNLAIGAWGYWVITEDDRLRDPGPLSLSNVNLTLVNRTDALLSFTLSNEGPNRLYEVGAMVSPRLLPVDDNWSRGLGRVIDGEGPIEGRPITNLFHKSDIIQPGSTYNVTRLVRFSGDIVDGDVYQVQISARYQDMRTEWFWLYYTCVTNTGGPADDPYCDRWTIRAPYHFDSSG